MRKQNYQLSTFNFQLFILFIFILFNSCQQKPFNFKQLEMREGVFYYKKTNNIFSGKTIGYFDDSTKKIEGEIVNGLQQGTWRQWFENGQIREICNYKNGKRNGIFVNWCTCGPKLQEINYKDDIPNGISIHYLDGKKISQEYYFNGKLQGEITVWYDNGNLRKQGSYKDNKMDSLWKFWNSNSQLIKEQYFRNDSLIWEKTEEN